MDNAIVTRRLGVLALWPVLGVVALACGAHALVATRFGWHRDEFYYVASGRHLAWGYVDQPPLTPVIARLAAALSDGVLPLRVVVIVVQGAVIVGAALIARELGGGGRAQLLTAACVAGSAVFVGSTLLLGTTALDQLLWTVTLLLVLRAVRTETTGAWIVAGLVGGLGLENKHTIGVLLAAIAGGLLWLRRDAVRKPRAMLAIVTAAVVWLPNLWWDWRHHWVTLDMARVLADKQGGTIGAVAQLPLLLLVLPGPLLVFVWIRGARWLARDPRGLPHRWLLASTTAVVVVFAIAGGKPYYAAPMLTVLFAAGAIATETRERETTASPVSTNRPIIASMVLSFLIALPVAGPAVASRIRALDREPMETYGWVDVTRQVTDAARANPDATVVFTSNYGEAGALATLGPNLGLMIPVVSGHNAYGSWGPPAGVPTMVIAVGEFDAAYLGRGWRSVEAIAPIRLPHGRRNEETANHATIYRCTEPNGTWAELWPKLMHLG